MMRNGQRGFTLVETLIVLAIISAMAAIAIPSFYSWRSSLKYKEAAWAISSGLKLARQMAVTTNLEHRVEFDIDGRQYRVTKGNLPSGSTAWTAVKPWAALAREANWSTGAACAGTSDINVTFAPNGSANAGRICVNDYANSPRHRVVVNPLSGRVYMD